MKTNYQTRATTILGVAFFVFALCAEVNAADKAKDAKAKTAFKRADLSNVKNKNINFGFNRARVSSDFYPELEQVSKLMQANNAAVKLTGHADNIGAYVYNWKLSEARAQAVKDYLINKGIDSSRVAATGLGDTKPIASNRTQQGRLKNRRVEIQFAQ